jgi:hypothetical protein
MVKKYAYSSLNFLHYFSKVFIKASSFLNLTVSQIILKSYIKYDGLSKLFEKGRLHYSQIY